MRIVRSELLTSLPGTGFNPKVSLTAEERLRIIADVSADAIYNWDIEAGITR